MFKNVLLLSRSRWLISKFSNSIKASKSIDQRATAVSQNAKLAVVVHLYYKDLWPVISKYLSRINVPFDLYVSVREEDKNITLEKVNTYQGTVNILEFSNRGRDVLPFLETVRIIQKEGNYQYVLKLHTKKSLHRIDGNDWLQSLLDELIPSDITHIIAALEKKDTGSIGPRNHVVSLSKYLGDNRQNIINILQKITSKNNATDMLNRASLYPFFGGTMFWARVDFIKPILKLDNLVSPVSFEDEEGQVDGTTAHALERIFGGLLHYLEDRKMCVVSETGEVKILEEKLYEDDYRYVG